MPLNKKNLNQKLILTVCNLYKISHADVFISNEAAEVHCKSKIIYIYIYIISTDRFTEISDFGGNFFFLFCLTDL